MAPDPLPDRAPYHIPVLLRPFLKAVAPVSGLWVDGTFGAGGYARALLAAGAGCVIGIDRDPRALAAAAGAADHPARLRLVEGGFDRLDTHAGAAAADGVVLDLGVSSMQLDQAERGFSFMRDGPLDMRMGADGPTAADLVNKAGEKELADILFHYGEERAARRIAGAIVEARQQGPVSRTTQLAEIIERRLPKARPGQSHPATRAFQAIRIAVNDEFGQLVRGLEAAERALRPGGRLAVVTFHSLEDRVVKNFLRGRSGGGAGRGSRHAPETGREPARFELLTRRAIVPDARECAENRRARSARLRIARRTGAPASRCDRAGLGLPKPALKGCR